MNTAPRIRTAEISEAALDDISGGLSPRAGIAVGPTAVCDADLLGQVAATGEQVLGTVGQYRQANVSVSF
ncbi:hypothetical protein [Streptomyces sp. NPDC087437]|uniref:hypothetical protein n=1 Tax=Streptomyces sp. NPDC087437 TaxID=3365789 RepID=UPI00382636C2